jgi:flagellin-like hook-associated protein FlgL
MRVTENMTANNAIFNINKSQNRLNQLNELLSSNQNINRPSDDPIGTRQILDMQSQVSSINQYISNVQNAKTWASVANTALQGMNDMLTQAKSAASNILVGMDDPVSAKNALATLENVRQLMMDMANVQVGDRYVFGGFNNATPVVSNKKLGGVVDVSKPPNQISGIDTTGLLVGMTVSGKGIQPKTTITAIDTINKIVTISKNPISTGSGFDYTFGLPPTTQKGNVSLTGSQFQITGINTAGLNVGDPVTGPGVPLDTTIASIDNAGQVTISKALTQAATAGSFNFVPRVFQTGDAVSGASTITNLDTTLLHAGGAVTGPGVPAGATIASIDVVGLVGQVTLTQPLTQTIVGGAFAFTPTLIQTGNVDAITGLNIITGLDTTNLTAGAVGVGDTVTGPDVPAGTRIVNIGIGPTAGQVTLSNSLLSAVSGGIFTFTPATSTAVGTQVGNTSLTSTRITGLDTTNLSSGMMISGTGVQSGTTILSVDSSSQITLSRPLTQAVTGGTFTFLPTISKTVNGATTSTTNLSNQLTGLPDVTGLSVGMSVLGPNLPENTRITGIGPGTTLTLNNNATLTAAGGTFTFGPTVTKAGTTNPPNQITGLPLAQLQNLYIGMKVTGPGIPDNTTITDIDTTDTNGTGSVTLSNVPTGPGGVGQFVFEGYIDSYGERTMMGSVTNGSSNISGLPSTTNMINAPAVSKSGSTNPSVNPNEITGLADTNGLTVGMLITDNAGGTIIPPNTIVTEIDPVAKTITLSNPFTPPTTKTGAAVLPGATSITGIAVTTNLYVGMPISGPGIPANTTITGTPASIPPTVAGTITLSNITTALAPAGTIFSFAPTTLKSMTDVSFNFSQPISKTGATVPLTKLITGLADTNNLFVGMPVSDNSGGTIIPANTTITFIDPVAKTITLSNTPVLAPTGTKFFFTPTMPKVGATVAGANQITGLVDTTNLFVGMPVTGPGIPANTTIIATPTSVPASAANTVTLSKNPTVTVAAGTFYFGQYSSMNVSGTGVTPNPTIGAIVNSNSLNLSTAATAATSSIGGTELTFTGHFAAEDIKVKINKSSQVALNYSASKLLLGGAPPATTQGSGPPPSTLPVNILGTIGELITAIQNKDDAGVIAAASNLKTATDQVNLAQTEYAGRTIRLDSAQTMLTNNQDTLNSIISSKQTLDTAKTIIQLQQQTTAYQAALQGTAKILPISLMDYLK